MCCPWTSAVTVMEGGGGGSATCVSDDVSWDVILVTLVGDLVEWPLWLG